MDQNSENIAQEISGAVTQNRKSLISMFISNNQVVDLYDAAGSLLILMLWVYYAAIIFLFGATFTFHRAREKQ